MKNHEIRIVAPEGCEVLGVRTEGDVVVIVYQETAPARIGYKQITDTNPIELEDE